MKGLTALARWLFILSLPLLFFSSSIALAVNSPWLYRYGFEKYDVSKTTGLEEAALESVASGLISYFNSGEEYISLKVEKEGKPFTLFNRREVLHLKDVKGLIWLDYWLLIGTLAYALAYLGVHFSLRRPGRLRNLAFSQVWGSGITLALVLALGLGSFFNFERLFLEFHLLSFTNELWMLNPKKDYLIMLFPQGFFFDAAIFCLLLAGMLALISAGVALFLLTRSRSASKMKEEGI